MGNKHIMDKQATSTAWMNRQCTHHGYTGNEHCIDRQAMNTAWIDRQQHSEHHHPRQLDCSTVFV